jgi:predicted DNA-binding transcriptional regulator AlpA
MNKKEALKSIIIGRDLSKKEHTEETRKILDLLVETKVTKIIRAIISSADKALKKSAPNLSKPKNSKAPSDQTDAGMIPKEDVLKLIGKSKATLNNWIKIENFPRGITQAGKAHQKKWVKKDVEKWLIDKATKEAQAKAQEAREELEKIKKKEAREKAVSLDDVDGISAMLKEEGKKISI